MRLRLSVAHLTTMLNEVRSTTPRAMLEGMPEPGTAATIFVESAMNFALSKRGSRLE